MMIGSTESEVGRIRRLHLDGHHEAARQAAQIRLRDLPENRDLLLVAASSARHLADLDDARATLDRLEALQPRYSRLHQERGLCHVARKDASCAIASLLLAVNLNPALPMSWRMLEGLYRITGDADNAATAAAHVATLAALPTDVLSASALFYDGELAPAERIIRACLLRDGDHPEAMRLLARIGIAHDVLDDAEQLLDAVLVLTPDYRAARYDLAQCLVQRHKYTAARAQLTTLLALEPDNRAFRTLAATAAVGLGDHEAAIEIYRVLRAEMLEDPDVPLWLGHAFKTVGRLPEAIAAYRAAFAARPEFGDAFWSLANLKTYVFDADEIAAMQAQEASHSISTTDRIHFCFALGKAFEDRGDTAASWRSYERGNALKRAESRYRPEIVETNTSQQIATCTAAFFAERAGWGDPRPDPVFILGLPRSGSTLLEQILSSHSLIDGTHELPNIQAIVHELQGRDPDLDQPLYPPALTRMGPEEFRRLGARYLEETQIHRGGAPFFIDKMPNNFRHVGLIQLMLPNATIIDARREPMACCFSNLKQLFAQGQEFTYSIDDIARYYRTYLDLMQHWEAVLPGRILRVRHEDVVTDLEGSVRRLLAHCGLAFEASCVRFHQTRRSIRTPSSEQVRQPIFGASLDRWERYAPYLEPLERALGDARTRFTEA